MLTLMMHIYTQLLKRTSDSCHLPYCATLPKALESHVAKTLTTFQENGISVAK